MLTGLLVNASLRMRKVSGRWVVEFGSALEMRYRSIGQPRWPARAENPGLTYSEDDLELKVVAAPATRQCRSMTEFPAQDLPKGVHRA